MNNSDFNFTHDFSFLTYLKSPTNSQVYPLEQNARQYQQPTFSGRSAKVFEPVQSEIQNPLLEHDLGMLCQEQYQVSSSEVEKCPDIQYLSQSNDIEHIAKEEIPVYPQSTFQNQNIVQLTPNANLDLGLDAVNREFEVSHTPSQTNQQANTNIGRSGVFVEQFHNLPEVIFQDSGCQSKQLAQQRKVVKVTYNIPTDQINQHIDEHIFQSISLNSMLIGYLGNSSEAIRMKQSDHSYHREDPQYLLTDSNQQFSSLELFCSQKSKAIPEMVSPPNQRYSELEEATQECKITYALSASSKLLATPLATPPVDESISNIVTSTSEHSKILHCPYVDCDKVFKHFHLLSRHIRFHIGEKTFICKEAECRRASTCSDTLLNHNRRHKGIKQYKCESSECNKAFVRNNELKIHKKTHTRQTRIFQAAGQAERKRVKKSSASGSGESLAPPPALQSSS